MAEQDRSCKPSTMRGYRSSVEGRLIPVFGAIRAAEVTALQDRTVARDAARLARG